MSEERADVTHVDYDGCLACDGPAEVRVTSPNAAGGVMTIDYCDDCWQEKREFHKQVGRWDEFEVEQI